MAQFRAGYDFGSKHMKLIIGRYNSSNDSISIVKSSSIALHMNKYIADNIISQQGIQVILAAIDRLQNIEKRYPIHCTTCIATASLRNINNQRDILNIIRSKYNLKFEVIDPGDEIYLACLGSNDLLPNRFLVMDIGGGSTEIGSGSKDKTGVHIEQWISMPVGVLTSKQGHRSIPIEHFKALLYFTKSFHRAPCPLVIAGGGIVTWFSKILGLDKTRQYSRHKILELFDQLNRKLHSKRGHKKYYNLSTIKLYHLLIKVLPCSSVILASTGVREGLIRLRHRPS